MESACGTGDKNARIAEDDCRVTRNQCGMFRIVLRVFSSPSWKLLKGLGGSRIGVRDQKERN